MKNKKLTGIPVILLCLSVCSMLCIIACEQVTLNAAPAARVSRSIGDTRQDGREAVPTLDGSLFNDPAGRLDFNGMRFPVDLEDYDYTHIFSYDEFMDLYAWLESLGFDLEDPSDMVWIESNFNKIIKKALVEGIINSSTRWGGGNSGQDDFGTHPKIMEKVFELLPVADYNLYRYFEGTVI